MLLVLLMRSEKNASLAANSQIGAVALAYGCRIVQAYLLSRMSGEVRVRLL